MRVKYKELMDKLGVGYELESYGTCPWSHYDPESGVTCSAEVRRDGGVDEIEAEIQIMYDDPPEGRPSMEQIALIRGKAVTGDEWDIVMLTIRGAPFGEDIYNWQEKSCYFFCAVIDELRQEIMPDIDDLIDREFHSRERFADQHGGGGGKSPKIKAGQLLDVKKGSGF